MQACPYCGKQNPDTDAYCYACGHVLATALEELIHPTDQLEDVYRTLEPRRRWGTAYFSQNNRLQLTFRDAAENLALTIHGGSIVVGRVHSPNAAHPPDVDLSAYDAEEKGVSRRHLKLTREQDTIALADLGSANGTYLNGQRLIPNEPRILRDGDELRLGRLVIRVAFI